MAGPPIMPESSSPPMYTNTIVRNIRTEMARTQWRWGASSTIGCSRTGSPRCHCDGEIGHPHQGLKLSFRSEVFMGLLEDLLSTSAFTLPHFLHTAFFVQKVSAYLHLAAIPPVRLCLLFPRSCQGPPPVGERGPAAAPAVAR